jgi:hypothetical protein
MKYSQSTNGFYDEAIHGDAIPEDAVEITVEEHAALIEGQSQGKLITADENGKPVLQDRPAPTKAELLATAEAQRAAAYREEADPLFFKYQRGSATKEEWLAKVDEIKARFPDPV